MIYFLVTAGTVEERIFFDEQEEDETLTAAQKRLKKKQQLTDMFSFLETWPMGIEEMSDIIARNMNDWVDFVPEMERLIEYGIV
jgi:hypothetical protein